MDIRKQAFDPVVLFEPLVAAYARMDPYPTDTDGLDAVQARKKPIWMSGVSARTIADRSFSELFESATARDLTIVIRNPPRIPNVPPPTEGALVFVLPIEEMWRIQALEALWVAQGKRELETHQSVLLGYTTEERRRWVESRRHSSAALGSVTIYTLIDEEARRVVLEYGKRCFGPRASLIGREFFIHPSKPGLKENALSLLPQSSVLARIGVRQQTSEQLFGDLRTRRSLITRDVTEDLELSIYAGQVSNVEFLTETGWE